MCRILEVCSEEDKVRSIPMMEISAKKGNHMKQRKYFYCYYFRLTLICESDRDTSITTAEFVADIILLEVENPNQSIDISSPSREPWSESPHFQCKHEEE
jgi:hypothetical protein